MKLKDIVDKEDKSNPLSDDALVEELAKEGYQLARRTVTKYRDALGIEAADLRRQLNHTDAETAPEGEVGTAPHANGNGAPVGALESGKRAAKTTKRAAQATRAPAPRGRSAQSSLHA
jgi:hypothetical protein